MKKLLSICILFFAFTANAQWTKLQQKSGTIGEKLYSLDQKSLKKQLDKKTAFFPNANGELSKYSLTEISNFDEELKKKYPNIKSYLGESENGKIAISYSPFGITTMTIGDSVATFIESINGSSTYRQFKKSIEPKEFTCGTRHSEIEGKLIEFADGVKSKTQNKFAADDGFIREFRLAFSCNAEFTAFHGGTAQALAAINAGMTIVNNIYLTDNGMRFIMVSGSENLIYTNAATDPFVSSATWTTDLQKLFDTTITSSRYDFGHGFMKGPNQGNAGYIAGACVTEKKGSAFSSRLSPVGAVYWVDYVAHEMGHQWGARHTFSHAIEGASQSEPGSGSTIMGYAGITYKNVQANSDPYFHAKSIEEITNYAKSIISGTKTRTGYTVPTVNAGPDYTIPYATAFELSAIGSKAGLTYCWEQYDRAFTPNTIPIDNTTSSGVLSRSFPPSLIPTRSFPQYGFPTKWDSWSQKARVQNYRVTIRDGKGSTNTDDMKVVVIKTPTPFKVLPFKTTVRAGEIETVNWDVAGTTGLGINVSNVRISIIAGITETVLVESTPNNGSAIITIPNLPGTGYRIKVKANGNIFYALSENEFTIESNSDAPILSYENLSPTSIRLTWTQPYNFNQTSFSVYQNPTCDNNDPKGDPCEKYIGATNGNSFSYTVKNLKPGIQKFVVKGKNAAGARTSKSNTVEITIK